MEIKNNITAEEYEKFLIKDPQELSELAEKHLTEHD